MQLGNFTPDARTGGFVGNIKTLTISLDNIRIVPRVKDAGAPKGTPDFDVLGPSGSDFGAGWWQKRASDGLDFISLQLYDPSFNGGVALRPALFPRKDAAGFTMVHQPADSAPAAAEPAPVAPDSLNGSGRRASRAKGVTAEPQ